MNRLLLAAGLSAVGLLLASPPAAASFFAETSVDFGSVPQGQVVSHKFILKNTADKPLHVAGLRTSCHCVSASIDAADVKPGESAAVHVAIDTRKYSGSKTFAVYVLIDQPKVQEIQLTAAAHSRGDIVIDPAVVDFGTIRKGSAAAASAVVKFYLGRSIKPLGIENDNGYIEARHEAIPGDGNSAVRVTLKLRPDLPAGNWHAEVWLKTDDRDAARIRIPILVRVQAALTAAPEEVRLAGRSGDKVEQRVTIRGNAPFRIVRIEGGDDAGIEVRGFGTDSRSAHWLTLAYSFKKSAENRQVKLKVVTDLDGETAVELNVLVESDP